MIITTESGTRYDYDPAAATVRRTTGLDRIDSRPLRRDGSLIKITAAHEPVLGQPWALLLNLRGDGVLTLRTTSPVTATEDEP